MNLSRRSFMILAGASPLLASCTSQRNMPNFLRIGSGAEVQDLDPHVVTGMTEHRVLSSMFEGLASLDPATLEAIPGAAERWEMSNDGLQYRFHLRPEAKWSNGDPVTAHDFLFSFERMLSPELAAEYGYFLHVLKNGKAYNEGRLQDFGQVGARAVDDFTLEVTLENPTPYFLNMQTHQAWYPVHPPTIEKFDARGKRGTRWTHPGNHVSNGPFRLVEWRHYDYLRVVRNEHYWGASEVQCDGIDFYPIDNEQTEERSFRYGDLHMTQTVPMHKIPVYQRTRPDVLHLDPYLGTYFYRFNASRPPFDDPRVRRAFSMTIDRDSIAANVLKGGEAPAYFFTPPDTVGYTCTSRVPFNPEQARALLAEAGYPNGTGFPSVGILYNTLESHKTIAEAIQQMWRQHLNVEIRLVNQDWKVYLDSLDNLTYDIARSAWIGDFVDPVNFIECFLTGQGNNRTGWSNAQFDDAVQRSYAQTDRAERFELLQEAERLLLEDAVIAPIYFYTWKFLLAPEVQGLISNIQGYVAWKHLWLKEVS